MRIALHLRHQSLSFRAAARNPPREAPGWEVNGATSRSGFAGGTFAAAQDDGLGWEAAQRQLEHAVDVATQNVGSSKTPEWPGSLS